ncbi:hypothetical protein JHJ32_21325 [Parapedobacter sp. ISTM3]|uniref:hypothetical protein n=1 Tax=Parapedobacter sp. ISTM3 TaxID=2800130 RepID=UPI001905F364|nr:hypothetical protein [Parapedobacter sp. ISTM3]MBK1442555.1 hypothetical protein [Parapedobacter sp. ISTM3]
MVVEIFKTDVSDPGQAEALMKSLKPLATNGRVTFDLEDVDKILRTESDRGIAGQVIRLMVDSGFSCELLYSKETSRHETERVPQ